MSQPQPSRAPTFEQKAATLFQQAIAEILQEVPELRSVGIVFDWQGQLNDAAIACLWHDANGQVGPKQVEVMHGCMSQTHKLLQLQTTMALRTIQLIQATKERLEKEAQASLPQTSHGSNQSQTETLEPGRADAIPPPGR